MTPIERFGLLQRVIAVQLRWKKRPRGEGYEEFGVIRRKMVLRDPLISGLPPI